MYNYMQTPSEHQTSIAFSFSWCAHHVSTCNSTTSACACVEGVVERSSRRRAAEISARYAIWARDAVSVCRLRTPRKHENESPRNFPGVSRAGVRGRAVPETPNERVSTNSGGFCWFLHANDAPERDKGLIFLQSAS